MARAKLRSAAGSVRRSPPVTLTKTSKELSFRFKCLVRTAQMSWSLGTGMPWATRRGMASSVGTVRAWISTSRGLVPSMTKVLADPGAVADWSDRKREPGFLTSINPELVIWKRPVSSVGPKRFLTPRKSLKSW